MTPLATVAITITSTITIASPQDWPQWRGPERDGISRESGWVSAGRTQSVWSKNVGIGYSSCSIRDGRLVTMGYDEEKALDTVWCLDAGTGETLWSFSYPSSPNANFHGGGTLTTAAIDGDVVYTSNHAGKLHRFDLDGGEVQWSKDLNEMFGAGTQMFHGYAGSPVVLGDQLIVSMGGRIVAFDKRSGETLWKSEDYGDGSYSTPVDFDLGGRPTLAAFTGQGLAIIDRQDGSELHLHEFKSSMGGVNCATPVIDGRRVFISSAYQMGGAMLDFGGGEPTVLWESKRMRNKMTGCVLWQDHLYGFDESMLKCLDRDGNEKWRVRGLGMGSMMVADGRLIALSSRGELIVAEATPEQFTELSRTRVLEGGVYWTTPVLSNGLIYCRNSLGDIVCRDHRPHRPDVLTASAPRPERSPGGLPDAADLVRRHLEAVGGPSAISLHHAMHLQGTIEKTSEGETRTAVDIYRLGPDRLLTEYTMDDFGTVSEGYDGTIGWSAHPFWGNKILEDAALRELAANAEYAAAAGCERLDAAITTTGTAEYGDRPCYVVAARTRSGLERRLYFEVDSGLRAGHEGDGEAMVILSDYRDFDGLKLPATRRTLKSDTGTEEIIRIDRVSWDGVEAGRFAPPEPIRMLLMSPEEIEAGNAKIRAAHGDLLGSYVANFHHYEDTIFKITASHGRLALDVPGFGVSQLDPPDDKGIWRFMSIPAFGVSFDRDETGRITALRWHDPEEEQVLPRVEEVIKDE